MTVKGYAALEAKQALQPFEYELGALKRDEVECARYKDGENIFWSSQDHKKRKTEVYNYQYLLQACK